MSRDKEGQSREEGGLESGKKGGWSREGPEARVRKCGTRRHVNVHDVSYPNIVLVDSSCAGTPQAKVTVEKTSSLLHYDLNQNRQGNARIS